MKKTCLSQSLAVALLCVLVSKTSDVDAQVVAASSDFPKLHGKSRKIQGATRAFDSSPAATKLPRTIILGVSDGAISIRSSAEKLTTSSALLFQRSYDGEQWQVGSNQPALAGASRAIGGNSPASEVVSVAAASVSIDQLLGQSVFRGQSLLTPAPNSRLLFGAITIRRADDDGSQLAAETIEISSGNRAVLSFAFPEGKDAIAWADIGGKPAALTDGLPPGEYSIRVAGKAGTTFVIEDQDVVDWVMEPINQFSKLVGDTSPSKLVYSVEHLLSQLDEDGRPSPYFGDALDLIETSGSQSDFARSRQQLILKSLGKKTLVAADPSPTGVAEVDALRAMIRDGRWSTAKEHAARLVDSPDERIAGLAKLYQAVIAGESSIASVYADDPAAEAFEEAIQSIGDQNSSDAFRAHINYANYLSSKVQSRVYNYALQSATALENPLLTSLWQWSTAREQYDAADRLASSLSKSDRLASAINRARHYVVLGDFVRNLRSQDAYCQELVKTAEDAAQSLAASAVKLADDEPATRGAALEVLAHIDYRRHDFETATQRAAAALSAYEQAGSLAGIESCHRTVGLIASQDPEQTDQAIQHFEITLHISELLRQQIELNESGVDRAGFFARHAYANERLIDLLVEKGNVRRALEVAEMAKARSFRDLLSLQRAADAAPDTGEDETELLTLDDVLSGWPEKSCAIEFFIGSRHAYAFCIMPHGEVLARRLRGADGQPLAASELVGQVTDFLSSMELRAQKMYREAVSGRGFDNTWQDKLHLFYQELIPGELRESIGQCEHLVIVPHHVLHYFPFAALVVQPDRTERDKLELPQPEFLIERSIDITVAPSLLSYIHLTRSPSEVSQANAVGIAEFENAPQLNGVERDLDNFKAVFGESVGAMVRKNPIHESDVTQVFGQPGLLLIGTHGQNEADRPLASFLLCNSGGGLDGRLTALELFHTPIEADVVILSACYSGLADRSPLPGDDLFGLQRAILQSGAKSVISGLWDVYDDTAPELVMSTISHFKGGQTISRSLAESQRDFLAKQKHAGPSDPWIHPYFWAVYACSGGGHSKIASR
ncbi:MAG: CHAT domain-containing protein [Planctomycetales bacterium]|nr:CHAT domain-containing protein [Planctomycetales bacterium]